MAAVSSKTGRIDVNCGFFGGYFFSHDVFVFCFFLASIDLKKKNVGLSNGGRQIP